MGCSILQKWKCESLANQITTSLVKSLQCCVIIASPGNIAQVWWFILSWSTIYLQQGYCMCTWSRIHVWGAPLVRFVMKKEHTMQDYQFHAQLDCLLWAIPAAHTVILLSESLLSPTRPISAGLPCWSSSYWEKDWKWERTDWGEAAGKRKRREWGRETLQKAKWRQWGQRMNERRLRGWQRGWASERKKLWT